MNDTQIKTLCAFIDALHSAKWRAVGDAQHYNITLLWAKMRDEQLEMEREFADMATHARDMESKLAAMTAAKELAERQVSRLIKALGIAAARLHTANTVGAFESGDDLSDYLAEGYRQSHEALAEAAKGVQE